MHELERLFAMYDEGHLDRRRLSQGLLGLGLGTGTDSYDHFSFGVDAFDAPRALATLESAMPDAQPSLESGDQILLPDPDGSRSGRSRELRAMKGGKAGRKRTGSGAARRPGGGRQSSAKKGGAKRPEGSAPKKGSPRKPQYGGRSTSGDE